MLYLKRMQIKHSKPKELLRFTSLLAQRECLTNTFGKHPKIHNIYIQKYKQKHENKIKINRKIRKSANSEVVRISVLVRWEFGCVDMAQVDVDRSKTGIWLSSNFSLSSMTGILLRVHAHRVSKRQNTNTVEQQHLDLQIHLSQIACILDTGRSRIFYQTSRRRVTSGTRRKDSHYRLNTQVTPADREHRLQAAN